jgi:hypothetical protein
MLRVLAGTQGKSFEINGISLQQKRDMKQARALIAGP